MKPFILAFILFVTITCALAFTEVFGQVPSPTVVVTSTTQAPPLVFPTPSPSPIEMVQVAEPAAPPQWASDLIMNVQKMPIIGPVVSKLLVYLGILCSILTALIAFLLTTLNVLAGAFSLGGLVTAAEKIQLFKNGKIMYWLKYLSMFNAKKPETKPA